jgi:ribonuclease BN (tRNA processing enzyme)
MSSPRSRPLVVAGPGGIEQRVSAALEALFPGATAAPRSPLLRFVELAAQRPTRLGPLTVTAYAVDHTSGTNAHALRIEVDGVVIAYSGDTAWTDALLTAAAGADLFICECYSFARPVRNHMHHADLAAHLPLLQCRRLLLTHLSADMLAQRAAAVGECAEDGLLIHLR